MFTWISSISRLPRAGFLARALALGACLVVLPGCFGEERGALGFLSSGKEDKNAPRDVLRKVELYDGEVVVRGPDGYCIDRKTMRRQSTAGFVLLASCESLSGVRGSEVEPVVMTVSVLPDTAGLPRPSPADVARSLRGAEVLKAHQVGEVAMVQFATGGAGILAQGDPRHWRGAMTLNGHLLGFALYARRGSDLAGEEGRAMLSELARVIRQETPPRAQ
jgi:hypothetical protein